MPRILDIRQGQLEDNTPCWVVSIEPPQSKQGELTLLDGEELRDVLAQAALGIISDLSLHIGLGENIKLDVLKEELSSLIKKQSH